MIKYELMGDYYIELPFDAGSYIDIPRGSYIDHEGTRYTVMENILPEPKAEGGYHYAVKFWAGQSFMKNRKLFWLKGANKESSFHITTTIDQFGQLVVDNMNEFMPGKWELSSLLPADALTVSKTISFEGDTCWDAVSSIAEAYGIEWWVHHDEDTMELHFGKLEGGNLVDFKVGEVITSIPSQKGDDSQYGTRFYVYGSNQNLPEGYGDTEQGGTVHHVSNPRLMLPSGIDYIDAKRNMTPAEIIEQVVIFEDVYPKNTDTVTAVTTVQRPIENAAEGQPQTFTAYQLIAANTPFLPSDVMENETLRLVFNSGALTGVEFEVDLRDADDNHIDPFKWKPEDGFIKKFELIAITEQVGDMVETLPNESVHPVVGDEFVLLGVRLSDDKVREAEEELLQRGEEWKDEHSKDTSVYNCPTNPVYCKRGLLSFALGQRVRLYDPRFDGGYRDSRIQGFEKRIWNEYIATYTIGDNAAYTRIGAVESSVTNLKTTERTIGMILDELASTAKDLSDMFEMVEYNKTKMIRANYDFFSIGGVTAGGIGSSSDGGTGGGGSSTLAGLNDVALKNAIANDMLVYNGTHWVNTPMSAIKPDLTAYATKAWVEGKDYALNSALLAVDARLADVETIFTADQDGAINKWSEVVAFLDGIDGDTLDSILAQFATMQWVEGKKYITADALAPYALQTAIPTKNSELENDAKYITAAALNGYATQSWVKDQKYLDVIDSSMVITALGYTPYNEANFTKANIKSTLGISDWALASAKPTYQYSEIQGIPDLSVYFLKTSFTKDNIKTTLGISDWALAASKPSYKWSEINERPTNLSQFTDDVVSGKYLPINGTAADAAKLGGEAPAYYATATALSTLSTAVTEFRTLFDSLFEKDSTNNAIKAKLSLYSVGGITAGGIGSGGSSGGGASYNRLDAWADYTNDKSGWVLSALLGKDLDTRVNALANAGYITASALDPYAQTADVANTYATQTALQDVDIRVQAIEYIFEKD
ncbi:MAG: hypothetical protein J6U49_05990, partial [Alistipes sp.]|nr:hypothetical protein [Alistipes sp.]